MKKTSFTEPRIMAVSALCRTLGISRASFYKWLAKYAGMDTYMMSQMKAIEEENRRLKWILADLSMQANLLREALAKITRPAARRTLAERVAATHSAGLQGFGGQRDLFLRQPHAQC